ncbi:E3 ubiquitin-protein ligase prt6 [Orobanche hederae]
MLLPHVYQDLLQRYFKKCCPECGALKEEPALCLLCGKLCSPNLKTCCRESSCQSHASTCGGGLGGFLLIRRTTILLQRSARQAPWPSPYLDAFDEELRMLKCIREAAISKSRKIRSLNTWWLLTGLIEARRCFDKRQLVPYKNK